MTYDTDDYIQELKNAGIPEGHARAMAQAWKKMASQQVATKIDLLNLKVDIERRFAEQLKWIVASNIALAGLIIAMHTVFK